jgi:CheY-like chemotaxis protein
LPAHVCADAVRLRAAVENLLDNAVKFTQAGEVRLKIGFAPMRDGRIRLDFFVSDSGIGMSAAEVDRLFRPYAQASTAVAEKFGGAGLGLLSAKRLAKAMGGDLTVESAPGRGSTFHLSVAVEPSAPPSDGEKAGEGGVRSPAFATGLSILCVEDNPYGRVIMNTILSELGHRADFVGGGEAALQALARVSYDLVLMDIVLSGMDGLETTRRIRALPGVAGRTPVIGISGQTDRGEAARAAGMNAFLQKPVSPRDLAQALSAVAVGITPSPEARAQPHSG